MKTLARVVSLTVLVAAIAGCQMRGYQKADRTAASLQKAAIGVDNSSVQLDTALMVLSNLVNNPGADLVPQFKQFDAAVANLKSLASSVSGQASTMQSRGDSYFKQWDAELVRIQDQDIRQTSADRRNAVAEKMRSAKAGCAQVQEMLTPFLSRLQDVRTALSTDLTTSGLASIRDTVGKLGDDAGPLKESLAKLSAEFKDLAASLAPVTSAK